MINASSESASYTTIKTNWHYYLKGYCAEYNTIGALVQQHFGLKCSAEDPPCPSRYISTDAYQCKEINLEDHFRSNSSPLWSLQQYVK